MLVSEKSPYRVIGMKKNALKCWNDYKSSDEFIICVKLTKPKRSTLNGIDVMCDESRKN